MSRTGKDIQSSVHIAIMAATLANRGTNPVIGVQVATPYAIARSTSSCVSPH